MNVGIRAARPEDADAVAALVTAAAPSWLVTGDWLRHRQASLPARSRLAVWVAERDGRVLGHVEALLRWAAADLGYGLVWVVVDPAERRQGLGRELHALGEAHVAAEGAHTVHSTAWEEAGRAFAEALGYRPTRTERTWSLDPRTADVPDPVPPAGIRVVPLRDVVDRREALHAVAAEAELDIPGDFERADLQLEEWWADTIATPLLDLDASRVVLDGETPVAFAWINRAGDRAEHEMTGTLRSHRGRGLATLAKAAAIRACARLGVRELLTDNDAENAPMLAINERLGYRPGPVAVEVEKRLRGR